MKFLKVLFSPSFRIPLMVFVGIIFYLLLKFFHLDFWANISALIITILGSYTLFIGACKELLAKHFALDYIAIVAILVSLLTGEFLVAAVLALMISSGKTLDDYAVNQAKKSLTGLIERIPDEVFLWINAHQGEKIKVAKIKAGQEIFIRKGEVIPLDGILVSESGLTDESSLTGEPYLIEKMAGDAIRSGTVNLGNPIVIKVTKTSQNSTYNKIVELVKKAQGEKSPLIRIADKYSNFFTIVTFAIALFAYFYSGFDLTRVLSVLAIATPCPLIIATPIALIGGVNKCAKDKIIVKKLSAIEVLSRVTTIVFDKTGTLTIGKPKLVRIEKSSKKYSDKQILSIAEALERNSLHPLAKAIVTFARGKKVPILHAQNVEEVIGQGILGKVAGEKFILSKVKEEAGMSIEMTQGSSRLALFKFEDELKEDSKNVVSALKKIGLSLLIFTGDKSEAAQKVAESLGEGVKFESEMSPEDKQKGIEALQKNGQTVAMIGDGINDAPALALSDVGLVFSHEEQTAASEAADIVFLGGGFSDVNMSLKISKRTINIAIQSILFGIGASIAGQGFASLGFIPPIFGAGLQEVIDVAVILNALRTSI